MENKHKTRLFAYYLPQYHPIPENDEWWGKGFTEWTNVGKAKSLFPGHYQPRVPADLGYYDLRVPETRKSQAKLAEEYGIDGFIYWHYWFGNRKRLLERPFDEVLASGEPDYPFALAWANETWKGFWHGLKDRQTLIEQQYPGEEDYIDHFMSILPALKDKRYICIDGKPIFLVYHPLLIPAPAKFVQFWQKLAIDNGLQGLYFIGISSYSDEIKDILGLGYDAVNISHFFDFKKHRKKFKFAIKSKVIKYLFGCKNVAFYEDILQYYTGDEEKENNIYPTIIPGWDHSPRTGKEGLIISGSSPELFKTHITQVKESLKFHNDEHNIAFIKSWNEWGEGNYLEPDLVFGKQYLEKIKEVFE